MPKTILYRQLRLRATRAIGVLGVSEEVPPPTLEEHEGRLFPPEHLMLTRNRLRLASIIC